MLLIKQAQEEKGRAVDHLSRMWAVTDLVLTIALQVNAIGTLSGGDGRTV